MPLLASTSGSKSQNAEWFSSDVLPPIGYSTVSGTTVTPVRQSGTFKIFLVSQAAITNAELQITYDSGATWWTVGTGVAPAANAAVSIDLPVGADTQFNMRQTNVSARTLSVCQVYFS